ncbi:hypothetical protein ABIA00_005678 [Bradyrhizobium ottawaense]
MRITLLKTSCAVSDQPEVWECVRSDSERGSFGLNGFRSFAQSRRGAQLGDFHEEVHADRPEERQPRREAVDIQARGKAGAQIFDAVGERIGELEVLRRAGLLHVIAGDRDRIVFRHLLRGVGEDVRDDPHRGRGRVDVGVAHHELFQNVVLNGA